MNLQTVTNWHKILGMIATIFIVVLSITGFLLLHTDDLRLQDKLVLNKLLLDWYEIKPEQAPRTFYVGERWVTQIDDQLYFNQMVLPSNQEQLKGTVIQEDIYVLAYDNSIDLLTGSGELIERLTGLQGVPQDIDSIGTGKASGVYIKTIDGYFISDLELSAWQETTAATNINWSSQIQAPEQLNDQLLQLYRGSGLPLERIILDLHSGRILGKLGIWIIDISVLIFIALSFTGWWGWFKRRTLQKEIDDE